MADPVKAVRDAAKNLSDAIKTALDAGYHVSPMNLRQALNTLAISETAVVEQKRAEAAATAEKAKPAGKPAQSDTPPA